LLQLSPNVHDACGVSRALATQNFVAPWVLLPVMFTEKYILQRSVTIQFSHLQLPIVVFAQMLCHILVIKSKGKQSKSKAIPVTGLGGQ
jgi:hypothetical protein